MVDDQVENYVPKCSNVLWSELDKSLKDNILSVLTVNAGSITGKFLDLITNLILIRKRFTFIIITESWLTEESNFVLEINGYKSHTLNRVGWTGGGTKIFYLENILTEVISQFYAKQVLHESTLLKAAIPGPDNMFVAGICRPPNTPLADFNQFITNILEYTTTCHTVNAGDFNIDVLCNSNAMRNYVDTFHQYGFINKINLSPYVSPNTGIETSSID